MRTIRMLASFALASIVALLVGCATPTDMALKNDTDQLRSDGKPLYLMTATIRNRYKERYQPKLLSVSVLRAGGTQSADRLNFRVDDKARAESDSPVTGSTYFVRMELEPGNYEIRGMTSLGRAFPVNGYFSTPLNSELKVGARGVYYLGHVEATVRERRGNEFAAGPTVPLIDQAVAGASTGSFDVVILDRFALDEAAFRARFPALRGATITKAILPPFDRAKAQRVWDAQ